MRLLHVHTEELVDFIYGEEPEYAILSHTWLRPASREVSYNDLQNGHPYKHKDGYRKLQFAGSRAKKDGLDYVWIDTCCINKSDLVELGKAINSMYRWYEASDVCYVYLADVIKPQEELSDDDVHGAMSRSAWFTRGWTLQELIAPQRVEFCDRQGDFIGTRDNLADTISRVSGVDVAVLQASKARRAEVVKAFSIAQRFAWGADRQTTEPEDIAYCLLGIFGIYMTPQYGEGSIAAFQRLQLEIISNGSDDSIFAWTGEEDGLLATSPSAYKYSNDIAQLPSSFRGHRYPDITSGRVRFKARVCDISKTRLEPSISRGAALIWVLACFYKDNPSCVPGILLQPAYMVDIYDNEMYYPVGGCQRIQRIERSEEMQLESRRIFLPKEPRPKADGILLYLVWPSDIIAPEVLDQRPASLVNIIDGWVYRFQHSVFLNDRVIGGVRVRFNDMSPLDVVFESDREKRAFRLIAMEESQLQCTISEICSGMFNGRSEDTTPWVRWKIGLDHLEAKTRDDLNLRGGVTLRYGSSFIVQATDEDGSLTIHFAKSENVKSKKWSNPFSEIFRLVNRLV